MVDNFIKLGYDMSLKLHIMNSHLYYFQNNVSDFTEEPDPGMFSSKRDGRLLLDVADRINN